MGTRAHFPRTLMRHDALRGATRAALVLLPALAAGCIDFVEPELPDRGAPALIEATIRISDDGTAELDARLVPGLDIDGLKRVVERESMLVLGREIGPDTIRRDGTRVYSEKWPVSAQSAGGPVTFHAPVVGGLASSPPSVEWTHVLRLDADTLDVVRGDDLFLTVAPGPAVTRLPDLQQWFLRLEGDESAFNISADGLPPDNIQVPARWIPTGAEIRVRLIQTQSAVVNGQADYTGVIILDSRLNWTVRMLDNGT